MSLFLRKILLPSILLLLTIACSPGEPEPDCVIDQGPCVCHQDGTMVTLDISPRPVRAMRELRFSVLATRGGTTVRQAEVEADLTMPGMVMGENRVRLKPLADGSYRGTGIIVRCPSGRTVWKASISIKERERVTTADFLFHAP